MPNYKLLYFDARALAEPIRIMFAMLNVPYEDYRVSVEEWSKLKPTTPFGQLPILQVDGEQFGQSMSITRYLARKFGLAGKTAEEEAYADSIVDQYRDFIFFFRQFTSSVFYGSDADHINKVRFEVVEPARDDFLAIINKFLAKSKSGFLVGDSLTWADIVIADNLTSLLKNGFLDFNKEKKLEEFYNKIHSIPEIKNYVATRKDSIV
ncbi:Glutathione S-transferase 4 [Caenorhabditis elegans]|uniref:Glutathione S-transferase 4 n=1 Tax=Caenorhabditis elegans TaxID=6239 RepID=GST4_CAEEL|nr:Glutathione S-transferase 4 [Caenorhabditis elegans]Q21355.1 RecName: Full=Glutathione S-transferase 4; AltName: Full=CeGST1; AltName: Full=GST class-sigma [Caenorhabditis elegans]AAB65417.1 glutathione S-transferase [Caenorhabditis elegans]CAA93086.1 Glutathione S-transferase 4 [Caenorhabditis elegans]|eukprot:NP_501848.1 Glutathione S-transferase 4 [Caenorhabditis elegans]